MPRHHPIITKNTLYGICIVQHDAPPNKHQTPSGRYQCYVPLPFRATNPRQHTAMHHESRQRRTTLARRQSIGFLRCPTPYRLEQNRPTALRTHIRCHTPTVRPPNTLDMCQSIGQFVLANPISEVLYHRTLPALCAPHDDEYHTIPRAYSNVAIWAPYITQAPIQHL